MSRLTLLLHVEHRGHVRAIITVSKAVNANGRLPSYAPFCWKAGA